MSYRQEIWIAEPRTLLELLEVLSNFVDYLWVRRRVMGVMMIAVKFRGSLANKYHQATSSPTFSSRKSKRKPLRNEECKLYCRVEEEFVITICDRKSKPNPSVVVVLLLCSAFCFCMFCQCLDI